jgi:hypothetical protein
VSYGIEWIPGAALVAAPLLLLIVPSFALIGLVVVALAAIAALVALVGAALAAPYLLVRSLGRRVAERHQSTGVSLPIAGVLGGTGRAIHLPASRRLNRGSDLEHAGANGRLGAVGVSE